MLIRFEFGLPSVSMKTVLVLGLMAFSKLLMSDGSTNVAVTPNVGNVCASRL